VIGRGCKLNGCVVAAGARLSANVKADYVEVQADAAVGSGSLLGANVSIGERAVIEANARIGPNASVGPGCTVREGASLASSIMLDGSEAGAGAALVNVVLDYGGTVKGGERITGMPDKVVEILANRE
jgi:NDP-sugar pyrophosphorylase family protein